MLDNVEFKNVLGRWATGVTVVTTRLEDQLSGMTVTAFSSVSLSPPLVLVCARECSYTCELIRRSNVFNVNVLAAGQQDISNRFANRHGDVADRFDAVAHEPGQLGCPVIVGALATLECVVHQIVAVGDHNVLVGAVEHASVSNVDPLLYFRNDYQSILFGRRQTTRDV